MNTNMQLILEKTRERFKNFKAFISRYLEYVRKGKQTLCRIEEVNVTRQQVIIHCRMVNEAIKLTFSEAVANIKLISNLPPTQASWLGAYYGKVLAETAQNINSLKKKHSVPFLLQNTRGRYTISSEKRSGEIKYYDKINKIEFIEHPITIASNEYIISEFDPTQACYIGLLAGIYMENKKIKSNIVDQHHLEKILKNPPKLRLVG